MNGAAVAARLGGVRSRRCGGLPGSGRRWRGSSRHGKTDGVVVDQRGVLERRRRSGGDAELRLLSGEDELVAPAAEEINEEAQKVRKREGKSLRGLLGSGAYQPRRIQEVVAAAMQTPTSFCGRNGARFEDGEEVKWRPGSQELKRGRRGRVPGLGRVGEVEK